MPSARFRRWARRSREPEAPADDADDAAAAPEPSPEPPPPELAVSERTARAILASGSPPLPPEPQSPKRRLMPPPQPPPSPPEAESAPPEPSREWNIWELERLIRQRPADQRQEEWAALLMYLREFANAEGELPVEFDELVRESFAGVVEREPAGTT